MDQFRIIAFIPARYQSTRLPFKMLHKLNGKTMLQWVYERASLAEGIDKVVVATDHEMILREVKKFGGEVIMTSDRHESGTDRIAEAASRFPEADVIVNVQGDQPFIKSSMITKLVEPYLQKLNPDMATVACPLKKAELENPNSVKVAVNKSRQAMFFTRCPIPYFRKNVNKVPVFQHVGLYAYTAETLHRFAHLKPSQLELSEGLEQMRALEEGFSIYVSTVEHSILEINSMEDIHHAVEINLIDNYTLFKEK